MKKLLIVLGIMAIKSVSAASIPVSNTIISKGPDIPSVNQGDIIFKIYKLHNMIFAIEESFVGGYHTYVVYNSNNQWYQINNIPIPCIGDLVEGDGPNQIIVKGCSGTPEQNTTYTVTINQ